MPAYSKPYLTIPDQIALIKSRTMIVSDDTKCAECLGRIGYYRLSGYWHPMRTSRLAADANGKPYVEWLETLGNDARFSDVVDLYVFDKKLRLLFLDAIERVEVGLRVDIALLLGKRDRWAHRDPNQLHQKFRNATPYERSHAYWLSKRDQAEADSKEEFVQHFRLKYSSHLPIWMAIELWDFGALSKFLAGMKHADVESLARKYGLPRAELLSSWVKAINMVRNICAHHGRLWNRGIVDEPKAPKQGELAELDHLVADPFARGRIYAVAVALRWLLRNFNPSTTWPDRLKEHFRDFPVNPHFDVRKTGFPKDWEKLPFWN